MIDPRHFENAPIKEAVFDVRIKRLPDEVLKSFFSPPEEFLAKYPNRQEQSTVSGQTQLNLNTGQFAENQAEKRLTGYIYSTESKLEIVQFRVDGFTFNRLEPYTDWEDIKAKAYWALNIYNSLAKPSLISRVALRYINKIPLPSKGLRIEDYLSCPPTLPKAVTQSISGFLTNVKLYDSENDTHATFIQTFDSTTSDELLDWIVDIDVYGNLNTNPSDPGIKEVFEKLHSLKNDVFFGSLEDKVLEIIG